MKNEFTWPRSYIGWETRA